MNKPIVSASILSADFAHLGDDIRKALDAGVSNIHFDVMDHHYVPNLTFGAYVCESLRKDGISAPIDVHLMVEKPEQYFEAFAKAGANLITFHPETVDNLESAMQKLHDLGLQFGFAFNPDQSVDISDAILQQLDLVLIMTVKPGFAGQSFNEHCMAKISDIRRRIDHCGSGTYVGVDGGIKVDNIGKVAKAGADFFVMGSGLFHAQSYVNAMQKINDQLAANAPSNPVS